MLRRGFYSICSCAVNNSGTRMGNSADCPSFSNVQQMDIRVSLQGGGGLTFHQAILSSSTERDSMNQLDRHVGTGTWLCA
jgi:hypothetical protein